MSEQPRTRRVWYGLLAGTSSIFLLALLPPFLPSDMQAVVRQCYAPVCHQLPGRSLHIGGVPLAICDRCSGIYLGLVLGVSVTGWGGSVWAALGRQSRYLLLGSLVPLAIDWIAPFLGVWQNGPASRGLTGLLFGVVAAGYVTDQVMRRMARAAAPEGSSST